MAIKLHKKGIALSREERIKEDENLTIIENSINGFQTQVDNLVVQGDSSVEAAQARVPVEGTAYATLKERLDVEHGKVIEQLAEKAEKEQLEATGKRIDELIIGSGNANAEVTDSHVSTVKNKTYPTLSKRLEDLEVDTFFPMTNKIINGGFNGVTGWSPVSGGTVLSTSNNVLKSTGSGNTPNPQFAGQRVNDGTTSSVSSDRIYLSAQVKAINACNRIDVYLTGINSGLVLVGSISSPVIGTTYQISGAVSLSGLVGYASPLFVSRYNDAATASGKSVEVKEVLALNLTEIFGSGKEPDRAEVDILLTHFPNSWFDGTKQYKTFKQLMLQKIKEDKRVSFIDGSVPIQSVLDKAGTIFILPGTYIITRTFRLRSNTKLIGMGEATKFVLGSSAILNPHPWEAGLPDYFPYFTTDAGAQNISLEDFVVEGDKVNFINRLEVGIAFEGAKNIRVENVRISNVNYHPALAPPRPAGQWRTGWNFGALRSENIEVSNSVFEYGGYEVFRVYKTKSLKLSESVLRYGWRTCFQVIWGSEDIEVSNCEIDQDDFSVNDTHAAITLHSTKLEPIKRVLIKDNVINSKLFTGVPQHSAIATIDKNNELIKIIGNEINSNGHISSPCLLGIDSVVEGNKVVSTEGRGFSFVTTDYPNSKIALKNNTIKSHHLSSAFEGSYTDVEVSGNTMQSIIEHCVYVAMQNVKPDIFNVRDNNLTPGTGKDGCMVYPETTLENASIKGNTVKSGTWGIRVLGASSTKNIIAENIVDKTTSGISVPTGSLVINNIIPNV